MPAARSWRCGRSPEGKAIGLVRNVNGVGIGVAYHEPELPGIVGVVTVLGEDVFGQCGHQCKRLPVHGGVFAQLDELGVPPFHQ